MAELATVARPYADALFQVARKGDLRAWGLQVQLLSELAAHPDVRQFVDSPKVLPEQAFEVIVAAAKVPLTPEMQNFLRVLLDNGRLSVLSEVAEQFRSLVNAASGVADAEVSTAYPIAPELLTEVMAALERRFGRKLVPNVTVVPELIGGVRVVVGDEVLDMSVKARLERMRVSLRA